MIEKRTWEDFVDDLIDHRSVKHICMVARATRWKENIPEIKAYAKKLKKFFKKSKK
jgi:hypothetical protein